MYLDMEFWINLSTELITEGKLTTTDGNSKVDASSISQGLTCKTAPFGLYLATVVNLTYPLQVSL